MKKFKKIALIVAIIIVIIIAIVLVVKLTSSDVEKTQSNSNLNISTTKDMENLINQIYQGVRTFPSVTTTVLDITDLSMVTYVTGLTSTDKVDSIVISEPMMNSQAYSLVLVKVKEDKDADAIAKEMNENINERKWICVEADQVYSTSSGNIAFLVMSSEEMAKPVYDKFKQIAGEFGREYFRESNEGFTDDESFYLDSVE